MTTIRIKDLMLRAIIGINPEERVNKQDILINVTLQIDSEKAQESDNIDDTYDYKTITKKIIKEVESSEFFLLEKLVSRILDIVMESDFVQEARVEVDKPHALRFAKSVSVEMERKR